MAHYEQERELQKSIETAVAELDGVEILDVELDAARKVIRIWVDHAGGVNHGVCSDVTLAVRDLLESYSVEVSSPGSRRPLRAPRHFEQAIGNRVKIRPRGEHRPFAAQVVAVDAANVTVRRDDGSERSLAFEDIVRTHLLGEEQESDTGKEQA